MKVIFETFEDWGEASFAIRDFRGITNDMDNYYLMGVILFDDDLEDNLTEIIDLAAQAGTAIIMIETCNLSRETLAQQRKVNIAIDKLINAMEEWGYRDMETYSMRLAFALTDETDEEYHERLSQD